MGRLTLSDRLDDALGLVEQSRTDTTLGGMPYWAGSDAEKALGSLANNPKTINYLTERGIVLPKTAPRMLGFGSHAMAYLWGNYVVKITDDPEDALSSVEVASFPSEHVAKIHTVLKIGMLSGTGQQLYAIIQEYIPQKLNQRQRQLADTVSFSIPRVSHRGTVDEMFDEIIANILNRRTKGLAYSMVPQTREDEDFIRKMIEAVLSIKEVSNINLIDIHGGNLGIKGDKLVFYDLGLSAPVGGEYRAAGVRPMHTVDGEDGEDGEEDVQDIEVR